MNTSEGEILYGAEVIRYSIQHSRSRRTLGIEVHPDLRVLVRAPVDCDLEAIQARVERRSGWISRQLTEFGRYVPRTPPRHYLSGETHLYLGRQHRLKFSQGAESGVKVTRGALLVTVSGNTTPAHVRKLLSSWYLEQAKTLSASILAVWGEKFKLTKEQTPRIAIRYMKTRWGSLSASGLMTLNAKLIQAPKPCIEYVVVHELCHQRHGLHDARFYELLDRMMPDWETRKRRLELALL